MPRIARLVVKGEPAAYHVICRSALDGFALGDVEKEHFVKLLRELNLVYFVEIFAFAVMGNHAHVLLRVDTGEAFSDDEIRRRFRGALPREMGEPLGVHEGSKAGLLALVQQEPRAPGVFLGRAV